MTPPPVAPLDTPLIHPPDDADPPDHVRRQAPTDPAAIVQDPTRLAAVRATNLLDSAAEPEFDRLTRLAVRLLGVPTAFFSLVDATRDFYKSACGFGEPLATARELTGPTFCQYAIQARTPLVIPDTAADPRYRDVPTVRTLGIAAYVGVPIVVDGQIIGSFCVIDTAPRAWTAADVEVLVELAASAEREIGMRAALVRGERMAGELREQATTLDRERQRLAQLFDQAPTFVAVLHGPEHVFTRVNEAYVALVGHRDVVGRPVREALPEVVEQGFIALLDEVLATGTPFIGRETPILLARTLGAMPEERFVDFVYQPLTEADGSRSGIVAHGIDVTDQVRARQVVERLLAESDRTSRELAAANVRLVERHAIAAEMNTRLQAQGIELEMQAEAMQTTARSLEERTEQAEAAATALAESEAYARHVADAMPVQVWTARPDGALDFVNAQAVAYFGVPADQLLGDGWGAFIHADDAPVTLERWVHARATGEPYETEFRLRAPDGRYRWHLARGTAERSAAGDITRWIGTNTDIEAAKVARAVAEEAQRRTSAVLASISDAFVALDRGWCFTYVNDRAEDLLQRTRSELLGQNLWETFGPAIGTTFEHEYRRAMATNEAVTFEAYYPPLDLWFDVRAYPGVDGLAVYFQDVSERHRAAAERERLLGATEAARQYAEGQQSLADAARRRAETAQTEAESATRAKSEFLATMSHEIRTPINAVLGYADLLALEVGGPLSVQQRDYLTRLSASGRHLLGLVNEVLDTARVESGRMTVARDRVDLSAVTDAALALVRPQADARTLRVDVRGTLPAGATFIGDEVRVRQIIVNLLANAVKFTDPLAASGDEPAGEPATSPNITVLCAAATPDDRPPGVSPDAAATWLFVRVTDTGIGIPADQLESVFEPFVQVERGHTRTRGGSGLGLAISRRLARLMAGDLSARSVPGQGSTFTLWLPAAADGDDGDATAAPAVVAGPPDAVTQEGLDALGQWLAANAELVTARLGDRVRHDARIPVARTLTEVDLRDHISTYLIDIAKMLPTAWTSEEPSPALTDGSDIQQFISERHGAQRGRLGFTDAMLALEFDLFREVLTTTTRQEAPTAARAGLERGLAVLASLLDSSERIARRGLQQATVSPAPDVPR